jgi:hypothetical protein
MDTTKKTNYRVEFTVERKGKAIRKALEGKNLDKLLKKVEELDGFNVQTSIESLLDNDAGEA